MGQIIVSNVSKNKRDKILNYLNEIKSSTNDIKVKANINEVQSFITENKYGLVFEKHSEIVFEELAKNIPVFKADSMREILNNDLTTSNFLLEGDNLQSLYLLNKTHKNSVDVIYIDPPYNNGSRDWKYNNDFVDKNDGYRHSKWLSMMNERLRLSKKLLKREGVLICAIDENELATLTLLLEDVFGTDYRIDTVCIIHNPRGVQGDNFSYTNEYALFVYKKGLKVIENKEILEEEIVFSQFRNWGTESLRTDARNCFYPVYVKDGKIVGCGPVSPNDFHPKQTVFDEKIGIYSVYPIDINNVERKWRYAFQTFKEILPFLKAKKTDSGWEIEIGKNYATYKTVWTNKKYDANENGTKIINDMVPNNDFDFPKSLYNVYDCLYAVIKNKPNAVVLDFFAGSGTTGHAVLLMNSIIGGKRKFILCTNNDVGDEKEKEFLKKHPNLSKEGLINKNSIEYLEYEEKYGIARSITFPRIKSAINGYVSNNGSKTIIFEEKLSVGTLLKKEKNEQLIQKIDAVIKAKSSSYNTIKTVVEEDSIRLYGLNDKQEKVKGLGGNLIYLKTSFIKKYSNTDDLSSSLMPYVYDLLCLKFMEKIDKSLILFSDEDVEKLLANLKKYKGKSVFLSPFVLMDDDDKEKIINTQIRIVSIPVSLFEKELHDVGEL